MKLGGSAKYIRIPVGRFKKGICQDSCGPMNGYGYIHDLACEVRLDASVSALDEVALALSAKDLARRSRVSEHVCFCRVRRWEFCMGRPIEGTHLGKNGSKRVRCCGAEVGEKDRGQIDSIGVKG